MNSPSMGDVASSSPFLLSARASSFFRLIGGQYSPGHRTPGAEDSLPAQGCKCLRSGQDVPVGELQVKAWAEH